MKKIHPIAWLILYLPFGALGGFVGVALTFLATRSGLSITEGSLIVASQLLISWLKWLWAPLVDVTFTPRKWYIFATITSAIGILGMSSVPLSKDTLLALLIIVAGANLVNSIVGMAVEALISTHTPKDDISRVSAWFQAGNLGGAGLGGALGLYLMQHLPHPWMAGALMGVLFLLCNLALLLLPQASASATTTTTKMEVIKKREAIKNVAVSFWGMLKARFGVLTALLCLLPIATGAAQSVLAQAAVAAFWKAGEGEVALVQGLLAGFITAIGCFAGGWVCNRIRPHLAYALFGLALAIIAWGMALSPATVGMYIGWNMIYSFAVGLSYAAFTAMALLTIGHGVAATGYNVFASLSNFPLWWLGLILGYLADTKGPRMMLTAEAVLGIVGVLVFLVAERRLKKS